MLFFLISTFSFALLLSKFFPLQPLTSWANDMRLLSLLFYKEAIHFLLQYLRSKRQLIVSTILAMTISRKKHAASKSFELKESIGMSVLDLPDLALECILSRLPPEGLCNMAVVCKELKERCTSDHLWEKHMQEKWGRLLGVAGKKAWQSYVASKRAKFDSRSGNNKGLVKSLSLVWSLTWMRSKLGSGRKPRSYLPMDTIMSCYMSLETGKFWFPAQIYNREHGHVGFMLSCYDAELSYDWCTDSFNARYPPHGRRTAVIEEGVQWERLRAPPVETAPHDLHISDCLNELRPGDHIEIQWRRNKEFPYGWWYGVVGHLDTCDGTELHCRCHKSDTVALEFNQYTVGSRWRRTLINRKEHLEHGNETDGFYGGIRRLQCKEEISVWRKLWPRDILD